ncbi:hypothetical protein OS493_029149 [Desmophyllum pertusum]|uniref:Uncharacterized protein n=1 Tax=Desmophyllum pertusum TaxID=174260 RepID=A0A9W9Y905_9CNID|nr:hypothetical protein OS493_029149 [Desmophyllum pertusum]
MVDEGRVSVAAGPASAGCVDHLFNWEAVEDMQGIGGRSDLWSMEPLRITMLLRSVYDLLPTPASASRVCAWCGKSGSLEHNLAGCEQSLYVSTLGGGQHNQVLEVLATAVESQRQIKQGSTDSSVDRELTVLWEINMEWAHEITMVQPMQT